MRKNVRVVASKKLSMPTRRLAAVVLAQPDARVPEVKLEPPCKYQAIIKLPALSSSKGLLPSSTSASKTISILNPLPLAYDFNKMSGGNRVH